jgi:hypothetical protein
MGWNMFQLLYDIKSWPDTECSRLNECIIICRRRQVVLSIFCIVVTPRNQQLIVSYE